MAFSRYYYLLRRVITFGIARFLINTAVLVTVLSRKYKRLRSSKLTSGVTVYLCVNRKHFYQSVLAMLSLNYFLPDLNFVIINDGTLAKTHQFLFQKTGLRLKFISENLEKALIKKIKSLSFLYSFYRYGWSGKKFTLPLLDTHAEKIIILDSDTLFFRYPQEIAQWLESQQSYHCYLKDYQNFSVISSIEATAILGGPPKISKVNSGLICFDLNDLHRRLSLKTLDGFIKPILQIVKDRMTYDFGPTHDDLIYVFPLIEQTLHWLMLAKCQAVALPKTYMVFPEHKFRGAPIVDPTFLHFTGEEFLNKPLYKYLFFSLLNKLLDWLRGKTSPRPWYIYSNIYCPKCNHQKNSTSLPV